MAQDLLTKQAFLKRVQSGTYASATSARKALGRAKNISETDRALCQEAIESYFLAPPSTTAKQKDETKKPGPKPKTKPVLEPQNLPPPPVQPISPPAQSRFPVDSFGSGDYSDPIKIALAAKCLDDVLLVQIQLAERIVQGAHLARTLNAVRILSVEEKIKKEVDRTVLAIQEAVNIYKQASNAIPVPQVVPSIVTPQEQEKATAAPKENPKGVPLSKVYKNMFEDEDEVIENDDEEEEEDEEDLEAYREDDDDDDLTPQDFIV